jgi:predicted acylesterase/phospholipase RssA
MLGRDGFDGGKDWAPGDPIRTRFVVDILSGTSAGGINGLYLAKALANGQDIAALKRLWVEKGDIGTLLNDNKISPELRQNPPQALLSGQYMYQQLFEAFEGMGDDGAASAAAGYVDEVDCFVTTTDIRGLPVPL